VSRLRIAVLGGGNGISAVLEGFARLVGAGSPLEVTAVVATADDGGSSGRLRRDRGGLPPGDLRTCLLALAGTGTGPSRACSRTATTGLASWPATPSGNLILAALADMEGGFLRGIAVAEDLLAANGRVLPVTEGEVRLLGRCRDGSQLSGEATIGRPPPSRRSGSNRRTPPPAGSAGGHPGRRPGGGGAGKPLHQHPARAPGAGGRGRRASGRGAGACWWPTSCPSPARPWTCT
jgi:hypothetical protein